MKITNLTKKYSEQVVLDNFSYEFKEGEIVVMLAPSGAGKTTLINCISNIEKKDEGNVEYTGEISMVFQEDRLLPWLNIFENVNIVCKNEKKAKEFLILAGLEEDEFKKYPQELSGGMKKRVNIARALGKKYSVLLMDEPFAGINESYIEPIIKHIKNIKKDKIIIIISHNVNLAFSIADKVMVFKGSPLEIIKVYSDFDKNNVGIVEEVKNLL